MLTVRHARRSSSPSRPPTTQTEDEEEEIIEDSDAAGDDAGAKADDDDEDSESDYDDVVLPRSRTKARHREASDEDMEEDELVPTSSVRSDDFDGRALSLEPEPSTPARKEKYVMRMDVDEVDVDVDIDASADDPIDDGDAQAEGEFPVHTFRIYEPLPVLSTVTILPDALLRVEIYHPDDMGKDIRSPYRSLLIPDATVYQPQDGTAPYCKLSEAVPKAANEHSPMKGKSTPFDQYAF